MSWTSIHPPIAAVALAGFVACAAAIGATAYTDDTSGGAAIERDDVDLIFESDWTTALGSTNAALLDTSKPVPWTSRLDQGSALRVLEGGTFRMPGNALEVRAVARGGSAGAYAANLRVDGLPVPAVGESRYYRWYIRVTVPDSYTADPLTHPIQDGLQGERTNWMFEVRPGAPGTWQAGFNVNGSGANPWPNNRWNLRVPLRKNETYRFGLRVQRTGTNAWRLYARVYDAAGTLLYGNDDFRNADGSKDLTSPGPLRFGDVNWLSTFQCGLNGLSAGSGFPFVMYYQGAFEIRGDRWPART